MSLCGRGQQAVGFDLERGGTERGEDRAGLAERLRRFFRATELDKAASLAEQGLPLFEHDPELGPALRRIRIKGERLGRFPSCFGDCRRRRDRGVPEARGAQLWAGERPPALPDLSSRQTDPHCVGKEEQPELRLASDRLELRHQVEGGSAPPLGLLDQDVGREVHRAARITAAGHGGQVLAQPLDNLIRFGGLFPPVQVHADIRRTKLLGATHVYERGCMLVSARDPIYRAAGPS
jgi:hypothetical protein